jgi:hypothetical protein
LLDVDPYPPSQYGVLWLLLAIGLVLLIVAWYVLLPRLVRRFTKPRPAVTLPPPPIRLTPLQAAKQIAFDRIGAVEAAVGAGTTDVRDAHIELSAILREFATSTTGIDARSMTLTELRASRLEALAAVVATYYPIAFGVPEHSGLSGAADRAREVLASWR